MTYTQKNFCFKVKTRANSHLLKVEFDGQKNCRTGTNGPTIFIRPILMSMGLMREQRPLTKNRYLSTKKTFRFLFALHHIIIEIFTFLCLRISFPSFSQLSLRFYPYLQSLRSKEKREEGNNESPEEKKSVLRRSCLFISLEKFHFFLGAAKIVQKSLGSYQKKKRPLFGQMYMNMTVWEDNFFCFLFLFCFAPF